MAFHRQLNQASDQLAVADTAGGPQFGIHADIGKAWQRVDFVDHHVVVRRQKYIDARQPETLQRPKGF
ncbi:hypothetical protein D3C78_1569530 [compost metagenome]